MSDMIRGATIPTLGQVQQSSSAQMSHLQFWQRTWSPSGMGTRKAPLDARIFHLAPKTLGHPQQAAGGSDQGDCGHRGCPRPCPGAVTPAQERPLPGPGAGMSCQQLCGGEALKHTESFFDGKIPSQLGHKLGILGAAVTWSWPPWGQENRTLVWKSLCYVVTSQTASCALLWPSPAGLGETPL